MAADPYVQDVFQIWLMAETPHTGCTDVQPPTALRSARTHASSGIQSIREKAKPSDKRSKITACNFENVRIECSPIFPLGKPGMSGLRTSALSRGALCNRVAIFPSKVCKPCNARSPAEPRGPRGLQDLLPSLRICTKKGHKARRREGDK